MLQYKKNRSYLSLFAVLFLMFTPWVCEVVTTCNEGGWRDLIPTMIDKTTVTYGVVGIAFLYVGIQLLRGCKGSLESRRRQGRTFYTAPARMSSHVPQQQSTDDGNSSLIKQLATVVVVTAVGAGVHHELSKPKEQHTKTDNEFECTIDVSPKDLVGLSKELKALGQQVEAADPDLAPMLLLYGEPGMGKSFIAKGFAKARGGTFLELKFFKTESRFTGVGVETVGRLFEKAIRVAKETGENVTVIIDEIEGHLPLRDKLSGGEVGNDQAKRVNAFAVGIDSINDAGFNGQILLIGTTNFIHKVDGIISNRRGRSKTVEVSYPKKASQRKELLDHYFEQYCLEKNIGLPGSGKISELAAKTKEKSVDNLRNYALQSVKSAVNFGKKHVTDTIIDGEVKKINDEQKAKKAEKSGIPAYVSVPECVRDEVIRQGGVAATSDNLNRAAGLASNTYRFFSWGYGLFYREPDKAIKVEIVN